MASLIRKTIVVFIAGFIALFAVRLAYEYVVRPEPAGISRAQQSIAGVFSFASGVRNYASTKMKLFGSAAGGAGGGGSAGGVDQKYEKIANVGLRSNKFDEDEKGLRGLIAENSALIQFEQREGLAGNRSLRLAIGVSPDLFDGFVEKVQTFGRLSGLTINKTDKTNEYRELKAKRVSLEKALASLAELKAREGKVGEMVELEKRILELEEAIQSLGVNLGDFDAENEFVTVKVFMAEGAAAASRGVAVFKRAMKALGWTVEMYALIWLGLAAAMVAAFIGAHLIRLGAGIAARSEGGLDQRAS